MAGQKEDTEFEYAPLGPTAAALDHGQRRQKTLSILLVVSVLVNILLVALGLAHWDWVRGRTSSEGSYEHGFATDLAPIKSEIELTRYEFTGGVELDSNGQYFTDTRGQQYVGDPSPDVDRAWSSLLSGLNIDLDPSEVNLEGKTFQWPDSGRYFTGLEVFHSLHCLSRLRQALAPDYYGHKLFTNHGDLSRKDHIGHCINHLRQAIQCHADLTPMQWKRVGNKLILDTSPQHTCRNFDKIQAWASQRSTDFDGIESVRNGSLSVVD